MNRPTAVESPELLLRASFLVLLVHQLEMVARTEYAFIGVCLAALGLVFGERRIVATAGGVAVVGLVEVAAMPWNVPNHLVVATLFAFGLAIGHLVPEDDRVGLRRDQASALLFVVFLFATLQKLVSPLWMDGSYPALMIQMGGFGHDLWSETGYGRLVDANRHVHEWAQTGRNVGPVAAVPGGYVLTWILVVGTLVMEAAIVALIAMRKRHPHWLGTLMSVFLIGTALVRAEFVFLSLVALLTAWMLVERQKWRDGLVVLVAILVSVWVTMWLGGL